MAEVTGSLLAKSWQLWPVSRIFGFFTRKKMARVFVGLIAALIALAGAGQAHAQEMDTRSPFLGGPNLFQGGRGSSPIPRTTVGYAGNYAPGTIIVDTAERRLYLVL